MESASAPQPSSPPRHSISGESSDSSRREGSSSSSSSSPSISTSPSSSSPDSGVSSGLSPAVATTHASVPPPVSPLSLPPSSVDSENLGDGIPSSEAIAYTTPGIIDSMKTSPVLFQNGELSRLESARENRLVLPSHDQTLGGEELSRRSSGAGQHSVDGPDGNYHGGSSLSENTIAAGAATFSPPVQSDNLGGASSIGDTREVADHPNSVDREAISSPNRLRQQVDMRVLSGESQCIAGEEEEGLGRTREEDQLGRPPENSVPQLGEMRKEVEEGVQGTLSEVGPLKDDEPIVIRPNKHARRASVGGEVLVIDVTPSPTKFSTDEEVGHLGESSGDSEYQLQAMSSAPLWHGTFHHEKSPDASEDVKTPSPRSHSLHNDSTPQSPRPFTVYSPHAEREMLRTQSMPTRTPSDSYQGSLDAKYRSRTGREGRESGQGGSRRMFEGGDVRKKVAEKLSDRKKRKLLRHIATVKLDGTVAFDVAGSTRLATELFGSDYDERDTICLNGQAVPCDKLIRRLQIVMLIVGTRGDVQPFVAIGKRLQEYGHRVRLASHANFRDFVTTAGLEYYPLGGDPKILAGYMVKNKGFLPSGPKEISIQRRQMKQICYSLLPACVEADGPVGKPFRAEAIIANPPAYGHVHVAEALQIPIHIFFTMPWTPTSQFPHPLARVNIKSPAAYRLSYQVVDMLIWWGIRSIINNFRKKKLKLSPITYLSGSQGSITNLPTGYIWSPHLVPKPKDWGPQIDVVGFCFLNQVKNYKPPDDLVRWLQSGEPPIYIGFGSLPVQDPDGMTATIVKALEKTHQRGLIDRGWGGIGSKLGENLPECIFLIENIPHDWLFEQCAAVVHHGGAGTTAAGLRAACPTTIVPFFGDQPFWGERVHEKGIGPPPIPVDHFNLDRLVKAIEFMMQPEVKQRAVELAKNMESEQGVQGAVEAFHKHLPDMNTHPPPVPLPRTFSRRLAEALNRLTNCCTSGRES